MFYMLYKSILTKGILLRFLFFSGVIFYPLSILSNSPKLLYAIVYIIWGGVCIFLFISHKTIPLVLLLSITALFPSIIGGTILMGNNMTNIVDFLADVARYLAPVVGFVTTIYLLNKVKYGHIFLILLLLFIWDYYLLLSSIIKVFVNYYIYDGSLVEYGGIGIDSSVKLVMVSMFFYFFRGSGSFRLLILFILSLASFIISPFLVVSKTNFLLLMIQFLILIYIMFCHIRSSSVRLLLIIITLAIIPAFWTLSKDSYVIKRYKKAMGTAGIVKSAQTEGSTSSRIGEIRGVLGNLSGSWYAVLFGMGNGAWIPSEYIDKYIKTDESGISGLSPLNYRGQGKYVHHVHSSVFAILNRNGAVGLLFYLYFFHLLLKLSWRLLKFGVKRFRYFNNYQLFVYLYGLGSAIYVVAGFVSIFPSSGIYGAINWGSQVAMVPITLKYLKNSTHRVTYKLMSRTQ